MDSNKLTIDFNNGLIFVGTEKIAHQNLTIHDLNNQTQINSWKFYKIKKATIARLDSIFLWENLRINSIIMKFKQGNICSINIPFQPTPEPIYSVSNHPITLLIEMNIATKKPILESKSEKKYSTTFGSISIKYDIHMLAISLVIYYSHH